MLQLVTVLDELTLRVPLFTDAHLGPCVPYLHGSAVSASPVSFLLEAGLCAPVRARETVAEKQKVQGSLSFSYPKLFEQVTGISNVWWHRLSLSSTETRT